MRTYAAFVPLLLLVAACAAPRTATSAGSAVRDPVMRVLVYNIHAGKDAAGVDNLERVAALVRETGADVALLQEVDRNTTRSGRTDQPAVLARLTGYSVVLGKSLDYQGGDYGIAVLSRWPIGEWRAMRLPVEPAQARAGGSYEPRAALVANISTPLGALTVVNTHLDAGGPDVYRRQETRRVLAITDSVRAAGGASTTVLVGGDFNSTPESAAQGDARAGGLRDAWSECGRGPDLTFPAHAPVKRIDYLYLTGAAACTEARVLDSRASDHRAVLFTVRLRPVPQP